MKQLSTFLAGILFSSLTINAQNTRVIPVVFHVLHEYGVENITDTQVKDAIRILNEDFQGRNPDTMWVISPYKPLIGNANIEFRLATKDPNGNCTTGIEHIYTPFTNQAGDTSKIGQWPRDHYLNIWTVKSLGKSGIAGYGYEPSMVASAPDDKLDGVMMLHDYIGAIGTGNPTTSHFLTHEVGHYLDLLHVGTNCQDGDGIADTPPTDAGRPCTATPPNYPEWRICNPNVIENVQNFMDASLYCMHMFTIGQAQKMNNTLSNSLADRNNLWQTANLLATGTDSATYSNLPLCLPVADFFYNRNSVCEGGTINFTDRSWGGTATGWNWTFTNGTPSTSTSQNQTVTFNSWGWQQVTLVVSNTSGSDTITKSILVAPPWYDYWATFTEDVETNSASLWMMENTDQTGSTWQVTNAAGSSGTHCFMLNDFDEPNTTRDALISPSVNLSACSNLSFNFKYACATRANSSSDITEVVKVYVSTNCGAAWSLRGTLYGAALANNGLSSGLFVPNISSTWTTASFNLNPPDLQSNVRFKIEYNAGPYSNAIYIDDINITGTLSNGDLISSNFNLNVYPNPSSAENTVNISYLLPKESVTSISLTDVLGKETVVKDRSGESSGEKTFVLVPAVFDLKAGVYSVKITNGNDLEIRKLIIVN